jgi:hypothetical protein
LARLPGQESYEKLSAIVRHTRRACQRRGRRATHAAHGGPGAATDIWRLLHDRLAELDLDVEAATAALYRQLTADRPDPDRIGQRT